MRCSLCLLTAIALLGAGCGAPPVVQSTETQVAPPPAADGHQRLDRSVLPTAYALDLTINPTAGTLSGTAEIKITLSEPRRDIVLHGQDLTFEAPQVRSAGETQTGTAHPGKNGGLTLRFPKPVRAGTATLLLKWTGGITEVPRGLYRVKDGERWYGFTQFQPLDARRVFPCFDQPEFKTPYRTTLRVPPDTLALSNSKETGRTEGSEHTVFTFAETQPLPTYLVAMAVGPFDVVTAPADALGGPDAPPLRVITTQGKGALAEYAWSVHR
jgi:alanyl aminopeptidase